MVLSHPYVEDYVVLPARSGLRSEARLAGRDLNAKKSQDDPTLSRWCSATWINLLWRNMPGSLQVSCGYKKPLLQVRSYVQWRTARQDWEHANI